MLVDVFSKFGKYNSQNLLLLDFAKLLPIKNGSSEKTISKVKIIKTYLRNSVMKNHLNFCMIVYLLAEEVDKINTIDVLKQFTEVEQTQLRISTRC